MIFIKPFCRGPVKKERHVMKLPRAVVIQALGATVPGSFRQVLHTCNLSGDPAMKRESDWNAERMETVGESR